MTTSSLSKVGRWVLVLVVVTAAVTFGVTTQTRAAACNAHATNISTLNSAITGMSAGQTVCLASGTYNNWTGAAKVVTITPEVGANVTMSLSFQCGSGNCPKQVSGLTIDGVTIAGGYMIGNYNYTVVDSMEPKNITIKNSTFTGAFVFDGIFNANILLDNNTHNDISFPGPIDAVDCQTTPGRLSFPYYADGTDATSGVTIQNSLLRGGNTDGIQSGVGINVFNNEFDDIEEHGATCIDTDPDDGVPPDSPHTDAVQLLGAKYSVVRNNYIHDSSDGVVAYDGIDHATIENNVIDLISGRYGIELYSDDSSVVRHNTIRYQAGCAFDSCGDIILSYKNGKSQPDPVGHGTIIEDNIVSDISFQSQTGATPHSSAATNRNNMFRSGASGLNFNGTPSYQGGAHPSTFAAFLLNTGSPGHNGAFGGTTDVGVAAITDTLTGDIDADDDVDQDDLDALKSDYGQTVAGGGAAAADLNGDGKINILDLSILLRNWTG